MIIAAAAHHQVEATAGGQDHFRLAALREEATAEAAVHPADTEDNRTTYIMRFKPQPTDSSKNKKILTV